MQRITVDSHIVESAKADLIEKIKSNINLTSIQQLCKSHHGIELINEIDCTKGAIVSHNGSIAFKLDLEIRFPMMILIDESGNCIDVQVEKQPQPDGLDDRIDDAGFQAAEESHHY